MNVPRRRARRLILLLSLSLLGPSAFAGVRCENLFTRSNLMTAESEIVAELARLRIAIRETSEPTLASKMIADFDEKLRQLSAGNPEVKKIWIEKIRAHLQSTLPVDAHEKKLAQDSARQKQSQAIHIRAPKLKTLFKTEFSSEDMQKLDATYIDRTIKGEMSGNGVMWSHDEKYVLLRGFKFWPVGSQIYDVQNARLLPFHPAGGVFSQNSALYAEMKDRKVTITDFKSFKPLAEMTGELVSDDFFFNSEFIVLKTQVKNQNDQFTMHDYKGSSTYLGEYFGYSESLQRFAFFEAGQVRILDLPTGQYLKLPPELSQAKPTTLTHYREGYFAFLLEGVPHLMFMDDLSVHQAPLRNVYFQKIPGTKILYQTTRDPNTKQSRVHFHDLNTQRHVEFAGVDVRFSPKTGHASIGSIDENTTRVLDLQTWKSVTVKGRFGRFLDQSPWLFRLESPGTNAAILHLYNVQTTESYQVPFDGHLRPLPGTEFWLMDDQQNKVSTLTHPSNFLDPLDTIGWSQHLTGTSPSGRYLVSVQDGKVVILSSEIDP
jgi:hypothetical protein